MHRCHNCGHRAPCWLTWLRAALLLLLQSRVAISQVSSPNLTSSNNSYESSNGGNEAACEELTDKHGRWHGSMKADGVYVLSCDEGYQVDGKLQVNMTCSKDGEWPAKPWCEDIDDCDKLVYGCGPAGLCREHVEGAECVCERDAKRRLAWNGEVICYFEGDQIDCGGRNCGAHGVCVNLKHYQNTFDTGSSAFRCSCERGYMDDGDTCVPADCGSLEDPLGAWSGSSAYLGEYTLECQEGAYVWGGTQQATTISCPFSGTWNNPPHCRSPAAEKEEGKIEQMKFWINAFAVMSCITMAALAAGLTMGLVSLEPASMEIIRAAKLEYCTTDKERERLQKQKEEVKRIMPLLKDHHLLLVTLLLMNAVANEALPIFLDDLVPPFVAVLLSVTFVLICGEILPSAIFTGPMQLTIASWFIPCVNCLLVSFFSVAKPIANLLDQLIQERDERHSRPELMAVLRLHSASGTKEAQKLLKSSEKEIEMYRADSVESMVSFGSTMSRLLPEQVESPEDDENLAALEDVEVELLLGVLKLGEALVVDNPAFLTLRRCSRRVLAATADGTAASVAAEAAAATKDIVVVFPSLEYVNWPSDVETSEILGVFRTSDLLLVRPDALLRNVCSTRNSVQGKMVLAELEAHSTVTDALEELASASGTICSFGLVMRNGEFFGLLDGEMALAAGLMTQQTSNWPGNSPAASSNTSPSASTKRKMQSSGLGISISGELSPGSSGSVSSPEASEAAKAMGRAIAASQEAIGRHRDVRAELVSFDDFRNESQDGGHTGQNAIWRVRSKTSPVFLQDAQSDDPFGVGALTEEDAAGASNPALSAGSSAAMSLPKDAVAPVATASSLSPELETGTLSKNDGARTLTAETIPAESSLVVKCAKDSAASMPAGALPTASPDVTTAADAPTVESLVDISLSQDTVAAEALTEENPMAVTLPKGISAATAVVDGNSMAVALSKDTCTGTPAADSVPKENSTEVIPDVTASTQAGEALPAVSMAAGALPTESPAATAAADALPAESSVDLSLSQDTMAAEALLEKNPITMTLPKGVSVATTVVDALSLGNSTSVAPSRNDFTDTPAADSLPTETPSKDVSASTQAGEALLAESPMLVTLPPKDVSPGTMVSDSLPAESSAATASAGALPVKDIALSKDVSDVTAAAEALPAESTIATALSKDALAATDATTAAAALPPEGSKTDSPVASAAAIGDLHAEGSPVVELLEDSSTISPAVTETVASPARSE
eukprot:TRINITY_DN5763_c0_g1_i1.p1 TRINITY_DN5763_c0_g1~~TRINITY_DN5763_c0_g1_i1.p1  ORF type:complete len:1252 (+),score=286.24 TRINITY_DN5763_c0_g1_i1:27-3758(+)